MRKVGLVFVIAVIVPSLVLAWLAVGSLRDQEVVLERQQTLLYHSVADAVASRIRVEVDDLRTEFQAEVAALLRAEDLKGLSSRFDPILRQRWPVADVGFVVALNGDVLSPSMLEGAEARRFRVENDRFLCSRESCEVYWNSPKGAISLTKLDQKETSAPNMTTAPPAPDTPLKAKAARIVSPAKDLAADAGESKLAPEAAAFRQIVQNGQSGTVARFLQDELNVLFWYRPPLEQPLIFGARVNLARLVERVRDALKLEPPLDTQIALALINAAGEPVAIFPADFIPPAAATALPQKGSTNANSAAQLEGPKSFGFARAVNAVGGGTMVGSNLPPSRGDWKRPFVATEIGEVLPHWEVAAYVMDPRQIGRSASLARLTVGMLIALLLLAIAVGSWLIIEDLKRQLALARQKTDFVSNVSHELKTPLTSIRMFSEMLAEGRVNDESKRRHFLGIITAEAARLTRLINNVLDFARLERGEKRYQFGSIDLGELARETVDLYRPHLEAGGFTLELKTEAGPFQVWGDRDALAQVLVNLLSNAEKYSPERKAIEVTLARTDHWIECAVLDRGRGVPPGCEQKIFEQFFRAHDSLAGGIQGSGLGLTLARQIAESHGGNVLYAPRPDGGSQFTLRLPLDAPTRDSDRPSPQFPAKGNAT
jgi:signal transduction histidine kinase